MAKKAKSKKEAAPKTTAKKKSRSKKKSATQAEVRQEIRDLVKNEATGMAKAVVDEGKKGQLAPVKYLFEVTGLFPAAEGTEGKPGQGFLADYLLNKLHIPLQNEVGADDESWVKMIPVEAEPEETDDEDKSGEEGASPEAVTVDENETGNVSVTPETIP